MQSFFSFPASSLFGTQQQLTHPPVKSSTLPLRKMPVFQGVAPRHTTFTSCCIIPLWDLATAHAPSGKAFKLSSLKEFCFSRAYCFVNVLILSCLGPLWFGNHPYYSLNPYINLYYLWSISIAKAIQNILFYVWSIFIEKYRLFAEKCSPRLWWS